MLTPLKIIKIINGYKETIEIHGKGIGKSREEIERDKEFLDMICESLMAEHIKK